MPGKLIEGAALLISKTLLNFSPRATSKHLNFCQLTYNNNNNFNCQTTAAIAQTQCGLLSIL